MRGAGQILLGRDGHRLWVWFMSKAQRRGLDLGLCTDSTTEFREVPVMSLESCGKPIDTYAVLKLMFLRKQCSVERQGVAILRRGNVGGAGLILGILWSHWGASFLLGSETKGLPASDGKAWLGFEVTAAWTRRTAFQSSVCVCRRIFAPIFSYCSDGGALLATYTTNCLQNLNWIKVNNFYLVFIYISVDSASTKLAVSKICMWCQIYWWNKNDLTIGKILIFKLKLPCLLSVE